MTERLYRKQKVIFENFTKENHTRNFRTLCWEETFVFRKNQVCTKVLPHRKGQICL